MDPNASTPDKLDNLNRIRLLVLGDPAHYVAALSGLIPAGIIAASQPLPIRRWGADFLAESLATPMLSPDDRQKLSLTVLSTIKDYLEAAHPDPSVVKSTVQAATSAYPLIFKHTIYNPKDSTTWNTMATIKSIILRRMDSFPAGVRACCIKFVQRVIQVQTPGLISDPRRPDQNEISLALVPPDHPLIPPPKLEAEAQGLLDRLLNVFQESHSDVLLVDATLNSVGLLVRTRPSIATRILNAILLFNPLRLPGSTITPRMRVVAKSMERTVRAFLLNLNKRNPNHPMAGRVQGYLERMQQSRLETVEESRKRPAPSEPIDGLDQAKRQRLGADDVSSIPPLPPGPLTVAQLFTLTQDEGMKGFDVGAIPVDIINRIIVPILQIIDQRQLDNAVNAIRSRYLSLLPPPSAASIAQRTASSPALSAPDTEDAEQLLNRMDSMPIDEGISPNEEPELALGPYVVPQPDPLTQEEADVLAKDAISRVFGMVTTAEDPPKTAISKSGFNRLAASSYDRDAWITIAIRLATRPTAGLLDSSEPTIKSETQEGLSPSDTIRSTLLQYVLTDFRKRIHIAIAWLNEEWYNDRLTKSAATESSTEDDDLPNYTRHAFQLLDAILPFLDARDKQLTILLSELPALTPPMLERVTRLASNPELVSLAVNSLHYLVLFRPPAREMALDALEILFKDYEDARNSARRVLEKFRPAVLPPKEEPVAVPPKKEEDAVPVAAAS